MRYQPSPSISRRPALSARVDRQPRRSFHWADCSWRAVPGPVRCSRSRTSCRPLALATALIIAADSLYYRTGLNRRMPWLARGGGAWALLFVLWVPGKVSRSHRQSPRRWNGTSSACSRRPQYWRLALGNLAKRFLITGAPGDAMRRARPGLVTAPERRPFATFPLAWGGWYVALSLGWARYAFPLHAGVECGRPAGLSTPPTQPASDLPGPGSHQVGFRPGGADGVTSRHCCAVRFNPPLPAMTKRGLASPPFRLEPVLATWNGRWISGRIIR